MKKLSCFTAFLFAVIYFFSAHALLSQQSRVSEESTKDLVPDFYIVSPLSYYSPGEKITLLVQSAQIKTPASFSINVYRIKDPEQFLIKQTGIERFSVVGRDSSNLQSLLEETDSFNRTLIPQRKKNSDELFLNSEILITPEKNGAYLVRITYKNKIATCGFFVTGMAIVSRYTESSILNFTCDRKSGEPVDSVKLSVFFNSVKAGEMFSPLAAQKYVLTDIDKDILYKRGNILPLLIAQKNDDVAVSDPYFYFYGKPQPFSALILTSQPVYRPPAKVDLKISLREKLNSGFEVYSKQNAVVRVNDPKGAAIYRKYITTDEFGSFSDSLKLEEGAPLGAYTVVVEITKDTDSARAEDMIYQKFSQGFSVEEYKKPEYKVEVKTDKEQYGGKEKIEIEIQSDYYFGSPVPDAEVTYNIYKKSLYRPWWYYSEYSWFYKDYYGTISGKQSYENSAFIFSGAGKLDAEGNLKVTYTIDEKFREGNKKNGYDTDYMYIISANVVDKSRSIVSAVKTVNVTRSDYFINAHTDKYICKPGDKAGLTVRARDFADKPVEANYTVTVNRVTYEKKTRITNYYNSYSGKTSYLGDDVLFIETGEEGYYEMEVTSFDSKNTRISDMTGSFVSKGRMDWWDRDGGTINILPEKDSYFPGDTAVVFVEVPHTDDVNLLITNYNSSIVSYSIEKVSGGSAYLKIPITDNCAPNFYFNITYVRMGNFYTNSRSVAVIPRNKFLNVLVSSDKPVYKPQEEGIVSVAVKDALGNPVKNSEVTIGIIDESVYAIMPENSKDIRSVFFPPIQDRSLFSITRVNNHYNPVSSAFPSLFEMYNAASYKNKIAHVSTTVYGNNGSKFSGAGIIVNSKYLAGNTDINGSLQFTLPEGEYDISLVYQNRIIPGSFKLKFSETGPNNLQIKTSGSGIEFAELNKEIVIKEAHPEGSGRIYGMVIDDKGERLIGARIMIDGTNIRTGSDDKGGFEINNIPVGTYALVCSYVGYETVKIKNIIISKGSSELINFTLGTSGVVLDTVMIINKRKTIDNGSGKIIGSEFIDNTGIRGIENIVAKTNGINDLSNEKKYYASVFIDEVVINDPLNNTNKFVEAVTRTEFKDAALWMPAVYTDENGIAKVKIKFPDNLTSWRVTAKVITKQTTIGQNTYSITERKDLIIRVETPRFFQQNDEVTVSTIVHNYLDEEKTAKVTMKLDNLTLLNNTSGEQLITIGKNEEKRVDWLVKVNNPIGIGNVTASALTNEESDAMQQLVPLQPFGLKIVNASAFDLSKASGSITKTFNIPEGTDLKSSNLKIGLSPSIASSLLGSLDYLIGYPYGCIEQTMSRFMPTVIAANTLKEIGAPDDPYFSQQIPKMVQKGLDKIYSLQRNDGGWGWWSHADSDPYMSAYVMYGFDLAKKNGYKPGSKYYNAGINFLSGSLKYKKLENTTRAFITFVLSANSGNLKTVELLNKQFTKLSKKETSPLAKALLSLAAGNMTKTGTQQRYITDVMREVNYTDDDKAFWGAKIKRYTWQDDNIITTALVIKALLADPVSAKENKDIIQKGVNWLISMKHGYAWGNTLQNAFIIYSLTDYIKIYNETEPDYTLKIFINDKDTIEKHFTKEDIFKNEDKFFVSGDKLRVGDNVIRIEKTGAGKTYFTSAVTYYEKENKKEINETYNGFDIEREYFVLNKVFDPKKKIYTYKKSEFTGTVTSGSELLVKVTVYPKDPSNDYFMLEDPIPAGCENIKEDWAYPIEEENSYQGRSRSLWNWWYSDIDIRDNRIVFFASSMTQQKYEFSYLLRAQIPGTFNIMPARGMLMYYPETNGSGTNQVMKIIDKK